jgi:hypothetical protein
MNYEIDTENFQIHWADPKENTLGDVGATDLAGESEILSDMLPEEVNTCLLVL